MKKGMKVLITAGGTTEKIDNVRSITNTSTGTLGSMIAEGFAQAPAVEEIIYVCSEAAVRPQSEKTKVVCIDTVESLEKAAKEICSQGKLDIIIHSMAVSDYRVKSVTSSDMLAEQMVLQKAQLADLENRQTSALSAALLDASGSVVNGDGKISSDVENMILLMERTPKVISFFQTLAPEATLVGFKLLDGVPTDTLIDKGYQVLQDNGCSFVLANDLRQMNKTQHVGYLIDQQKNYKSYQTKQEIAAAIVKAVIEERRAE